MRARRVAVAVSVGLLGIAACGDDDDSATAPTALGDEAITVGSFDFPESVLLAEIYSQALERGGFHVERAFHLGPREFVSPALRAGLVELVPEYAGTAVGFLSLGAVRPAADPASAHDELEQAVAGTDIAALAAAPAENANTFAVTPETARRYHLARLSDLAPVAHDLTFGGPAECESRPLCLRGLRDRYGLRFASFVTLDAGGPVTHQALLDGAVDVALLFSSDPEVDHYVELTDDRGLQPAENLTPLIRREVIDRWGPQVVDVIDGVSHELRTETLRRLNAADAGEEGSADVSTIAAQWLTSLEAP
jgi:osmoprotectant transport system substrate-binding protein